MNFNEKQMNEIYEFISRYNSDENFREEKEQLYYENPGMLSILEIYALEEVLRFGNNGIYESLLEMQENNINTSTFETINDFLKLYYTDENFRKIKLEQFFDEPDSLSELEVFALTVIIKAQLEPEDLHEKLTVQLEYDNLNPIKYGNDAEIRNTLTNLLFGEFIHKILEQPEMKPIKVRQKKSGMIADIDKPTILEIVRKVVPNTLDDVAKIIDQWYVRVKFNVLLGKGEEAFSEYSKYNTNISVEEIFGEIENKKHK